MKGFHFFAAYLLLYFPAQAQSESDWVFDDTSLPEIHITINPDYLHLIFEDVQSYTEYPATFVFTREGISDTVQNIGFRLRGNTSRVSKKKSFKVSFNTFVPGREYRGLDKMNLNGEHNDPSIIRSKLSWDLFNMAGIISSRANHVRLFINDEFYGLYINVEHIDDEFLKKRFTQSDGNLYKCLYPADLTYLGSSPEDYKKESDGRRIYDLTTNEEEDDYTDLAEFIIFLNTATDKEFESQIRDYINVETVLQVIAMDMLTGMWDDYMFLNNNYYLYHNPETDLFEFIPYDYDNTFGIDWFDIDWAKRDINNWGSSDPRPLTDRLLAIPKYKHRLHYYINQFIENYFNTEVLFPEITRLKTMIQASAEEDIYRTLDYGYSINDFHLSYNQALGAHLKYGLREYIETRIAYAKQQLNLQNIVPVISDVTASISYQSTQPELIVTATAFDDDTTTLTAYYSGIASGNLLLKDDGVAPDAISGDGIYSGSYPLPATSGTLTLYVEATDRHEHTERYPFNPDNYLQLDVATTATNLMINEIMASNKTTITDETGAYPDWVELYNPTDQVISLADYYLTDDLSEPDKWAFPDTSIAPKGFLLVFADGDEEDGPLHTSYSLDKDGEEIGLFQFINDSYISIDAFSFGEQSTDVSYGRQPDGSPSFVFFMHPTPGATNGDITGTEPTQEYPTHIQLFQNYPNPFNPSTIIRFQLDMPTHIQLNVYDMQGREVATLVNGYRAEGSYSIPFHATQLASGVYYYRLLTKDGTALTKHMLLIK